MSAESLLLPALISISDFAVNAFFVILGSCVSVGLALWVEVSGLADRLKARREKSVPRDGDGATFRRWPSSPKTWSVRDPEAGQSELSILADRSFAKNGKRLSWLATPLLVMAMLSSLLLGVLLVLLSYALIFLLPTLGFSEGITAGLSVPLFLAGVFAISWSWVRELPLPLKARVLVGASFPIVLFGLAVLSVETENGLVHLLSSIFTWAVVLIPGVSLALRSSLMRLTLRRFTSFP